MPWRGLPLFFFSSSLLLFFSSSLLLFFSSSLLLFFSSSSLLLLGSLLILLLSKLPLHRASRLAVRRQAAEKPVGQCLERMGEEADLHPTVISRLDTVKNVQAGQQVEHGAMPGRLFEPIMRTFENRDATRITLMFDFH
ncbi:hypothetical protein [Cobetia marina]|uniref:hypothetical protein n=1 Tax=Cobetia marina TaxID=28258 RepID=UPI002546C50F|nr:hypothetical protein [Cobetia pacifica]MDI6005097.1 hypothetical protein [Cobetia pacifica]